MRLLWRKIEAESREVVEFFGRGSKPLQIAGLGTVVELPSGVRGGSLTAQISALLSALRMTLILSYCGVEIMKNSQRTQFSVNYCAFSDAD